MAININREVEDTFYRYKMPKLQAKVEGKGNGIKTVIVNVTEIARALYRKPMYVTKYFGCELGAQVNVDEKNDRYIVNGAHDAEKLQQLLDGFIKKFVLCQNCNNPETVLSVKKRAETVKSTCKACGASRMLDPVHRLTQFIIKNPPEDGQKTKATKPKATKAKEANGSEDEGDESPGNATLGDRPDDDEDWCEDTTEEAQKQRAEELSSFVKSLAIGSEVEKSKTERAQIFFTTVSTYYKSDELSKRINEVCDEADRLDLGPRAVLVLAEVLLKQPDTVIENMKKFAPLFCKVIELSGSSEKSQLNLLNGIVTLTSENSDMLRKAALLVKTMYDVDVCEESSILQWADKGPSSKYGSKSVHEQVLQKCEVFFNWLREAEESSDEEGSDSNDENANVIESKPVTNGKTVNTVAEPTKAAAKSEESDDEIDIDAI